MKNRAIVAIPSIIIGFVIANRFSLYLILNTYNSSSLNNILGAIVFAICYGISDVIISKAIGLPLNRKTKK